MARRKLQIKILHNPFQPEYRCPICGLRFNLEEWFDAIVAEAQHGPDEAAEIVRMFFHEDCFLAKKTKTPLMRALIPWEMYRGGVNT